MTDLIHQQLDEGLLTLRLNRADKLNALTNAMYTRLAELFEAANNDPQVEVILIMGKMILLHKCQKQNSRFLQVPGLGPKGELKLP